MFDPDGSSERERSGGGMHEEGTAREEGEQSPAPSPQDRPLATAPERKERSQGQRTILSSRHSM